MSSILNCTTLTTTCVLPLVNDENKISSITNNTTNKTCINELYVCNINAGFLNVCNSAGGNKVVYICNSAGTTIDCFIFDNDATTKKVGYLKNGVAGFKFKCNSGGTDLCYTNACGIGGTHFLVVNCGGTDYYLPVKRYQYSNGTLTQNGIGNSLFTNSGFNNTGRACKFALATATTGNMLAYTVKANSFNNKLTSLICNDSQVNQTCDKIKYYVCWETCSCNCARGHMVKISIKPLEYIECSTINNEHHCICLKIDGTEKTVCNETITGRYESDSYSYCTIRGVKCSFLKDLTYTYYHIEHGSINTSRKFTVVATRPTDCIFGRTNQWICKTASFTVNYKNPHSGGSDWQKIDSGSTCICI